MRYAFEYAVRHGRKKVTLVHKANILKLSQGLFLESGRKSRRSTKAHRLRREDHRRVRDGSGDASRAIRCDRDDEPLRRHPLRPDLRTRRRARTRAGREHRRARGDFEAVHGTAPDIAGQNAANPGALLLAACLMLDHLGDGERATGCAPPSSRSCASRSTSRAIWAARPPPRSSRTPSSRGWCDLRPARLRPAFREAERSGTDRGDRAADRRERYDVAAVSGDISQRARPRESRRGRVPRGCGELSQIIVVPGTTT